MTHRAQVALLARTFFSRMFESDLLPAGMPQTQIVFSALVFLAGPALALPVLLAKKYIGRPPEMVHAAMAQDRALILLLAMLASAMVTLVLWEKAFPDRRDCRTLGVLPIAPNTFVVARLTSLVGLFLLLFGTSAALWASSLGTIHAVFGAPGGFVRNVIGQFIAIAGIEAAVFFGIIGVQCAIVSAVGPTLAQRLAVIMQMLIVVLTLQLPMLLPPRDAFRLAEGVAPGWVQPAILWPLPSMWFMALHDLVATGGYPESRVAAVAAAASAGVVPMLALAFYAASYRRLTRLAIEGRPASPRDSRRSLTQRLTAAATRGASHAATSGVCAFAIRTLARSQQHRMLLSIWIGLAVALTISTLLPLFVRWQPGALDRPGAAVLVVPLIFIALIATGLRMLYALPTEIKANWIFRLAEPAKPASAIAGATAAIMVCGVLPAVLLALVMASWLWGIVAGIQHALLCAVLGALLTQALMGGTDKIPFTCTYVPGKARVTNFWPAYLIAFSTFTAGMATAAAAVLGTAAPFLLMIAILLVITLALWWSRMRANALLTGLRFQEEEEDRPTLLSLQ